MALTNSNVQMTFTGYTIEDGGIRCHFSAFNPGGGQETEYSILLLDAELAAVTTQVQLRNLVQTKLDRKLRAASIASKLDQFIGQTLTV